jgi:hypothetical protein
MARLPDSWVDGFGDLNIFALFTCDCGALCAMADQRTNGNAAMVHTTPHCPRFEALKDQKEAIAYFTSLEELEASPELLRRLERETVSA